MKSGFKVEARVGRPQIAYKEAFTFASEGEAKYMKETGGRTHYAHVRLRLLPGDRGAGYVFKDDVVDGAIPAAFVPSVDEGISEALARGILAGYPIEDARIEVYDGSHHEIHSSAAAFRIAGAMAFRDAATRARPVLLAGCAPR